MDDQTKIQACWKALAPLARQATRILDGWRKSSRQADRLNELQQRALAACSRGTYPQEDGEPHWTIARRINDLRSAQTAIYERAAAVLLDLEQILPLDKIETLEQEIDRGSVRRTCQGILTAAKYLNERYGPAPADWPGSPDVFWNDSEIDVLEAQVKEMDIRQQRIDAEEQERSQKEQADARRKAEAQEQSTTINECAKRLAAAGLDAEKEIKLWVKRDSPAPLKPEEEKQKIDNAMRRFYDAKKTQEGKS